MSRLKVVALISGGKDSFFSILHCQQNGHEVVALANLHPPSHNGDQTEDMDSFMYQTVGHAVIPLYEEALGLPLYRQEILGSAVDQNKSYAAPAASYKAVSGEDETESLLPLLKTVMEHHPEVNAVSTGAILSDYQRTRVESIAIRLGLVPLSYLWQYPFLPPYSETSLLDDMISVGQDARIIKVASGGLDDSFLWENVANPRTKARLVKAMARFGALGDGAALGEGGEFETLAIDGPAPLWKQRIVIDKENRTTTAGEAGVTSIKIKKACLVPKEQTQSQQDNSTVRIPSLFDDAFMDYRTALDKDLAVSQATGLLAYTESRDNIMTEATMWALRKTKNGTVLSNATGLGDTAAEQMKAIMSRLTTEYGITPSSMAFTTIVLRNMTDFASVNGVYGSYFTAPNPPARVTIACGDTMPRDVHVSLSVLALDESASETKQGLHVQSRSYWAPANIGPYSQAVSALTDPTNTESKNHRLFYVAGQIPLVPASMELAPRGDLSSSKHFEFQATLSLQHLWRIGQILNIKLWLGSVAFVARNAHRTSGEVLAASRLWSMAHSSADQAGDSDDEDEDIDVWDRVHGHHQSHHSTGPSLGGQTKRSGLQSSFTPPCFVAEVEELPRSASIEWTSVGLDGRAEDFDLKVLSTDESTCATLTTSKYQTSSLEARWICHYSTDSLNNAEQQAGGPLPEDAVGSYTVYTTTAVPNNFTTRRRPQIIPCYRIWDAEGRPAVAVIAYRSA